MSLQKFGFVTVKELAEKHGLKYHTLLKRIHRHKVEFLRVGTVMLIRTDAVKHVIKQAGDAQ